MLPVIPFWGLVKNGLSSLTRLNPRTLVKLIPAIVVLLFLFLLFILADQAAATVQPDSRLHSIIEIAEYIFGALMTLFGGIFLTLGGIWIIILLLALIQDEWRKFQGARNSASQKSIICRGHHAPVIGLSWSPDGQSITSWDTDSHIYLWNAAAGTQPTPLPFAPARTSPVLLKASPNGQRIAYLSYDPPHSAVLVAEKAKNTICATYSGHVSRVTWLDWSPDNRRIATASTDRTVHVWDVDRPQQPLCIYREHTAAVNVVAWSPDGTRIASGGEDHTLHIWQPRPGQPYP
jgi:WD40 repeat protein